MFKRLFNLTICLVMILGSLFIVGGEKSVNAESMYLNDIAGISAWYKSSESITLSEIKGLFSTVEIETTDYIVGKIVIGSYNSIYYPYVFVHTDGTIMAFYLNGDPAAKMIDVIGQTLETTLLEQAVETIAGSDVEVSYYDYRYPAATNLLLISEEKDPVDIDNYFILNMPVENTYFERSYGFYQNYYPIFRLNTVNFVTTNALYRGPYPAGSIYGILSEEELAPELDNLFMVDSFNATGVVGYGAILITYAVPLEPTDDITFEYTDAYKVIPLTIGASLDPIDVFPVGFDKSVATTDIDNNRTLNWTLEWGNSSAPNYEYCVTDQVDEFEIPIFNNWVSAGSLNSVDVSVPLFNHTYYWQVRAFNDFGIVYADDGLWGEFSTGDPVTPDPFEKVSPASSDEISPTAVVLDWNPSLYGAYSYEYCVSTDFDTNCTSDSANWINVGLQTSVKLDVEFGEEYEWQVRAVNPDFITVADDGIAWTFSTTSDLFKSKPVDGATVNSKVDLIWQKLGASTYEYCLDMVDDDRCGEDDDEWIDIGLSTSVPVSGLKMNKTYYWQVRATNVAETTIYANSGNWWSFKVKNPTTGIGFVKEAPEDGSTGQPISGLTLDWSAASRAKSYEYCIKTNLTDTCSWISVGAETTTSLTGLENSKLYYWQIRAKVANSYVYADDSADAYWKFTTVAP